MQQLTQHNSTAEAAVSAAATGSAWAAVLADANQVLITAATIIAIISGSLALYDRWRQYKRKK